VIIIDSITYKSSRKIILRNIAIPFFGVCAFVFALLLAPDSADVVIAILVACCIITGIMAYFSLYRYNITVTVTDTAVTFARGGKEYLNFPFETFDFTSYVVRHSYNGIPTSTDRNLRVIPKSGGRPKDYQCHNFDRNTFEMFINRVRAYGRGIKNGAINAPDTPIPFKINKTNLINLYNTRLIIFLAIETVLIILDFIFIYDLKPVFLHTIYIAIGVMGLLFALYLPPMRRIKNNTPDEIVIAKDHLSLGDSKFYYSDIELIKLTPPDYSNNEAILFAFTYKMTIVCNNETRIFTIDGGGKKTIFEDYRRFCFEIENIFVNQPERFMYELW